MDRNILARSVPVAFDDRSTFSDLLRDAGARGVERTESEARLQ